MEDFVLSSAIKQGNMRNCGLVTQLGVVVFNRRGFQGRRNRWQPITWSNSHALLPKETIWKYSTPVSLIKQMISHIEWPKLTQLIHCVLVTSYDDIDLFQHWLSVNLPTKGILLRAISWEMLKISIRKLSLKIRLLKLFPHLPGTDEFIQATTSLPFSRQNALS